MWAGPLQYSILNKHFNVGMYLYCYILYVHSHTVRMILLHLDEWACLVHRCLWCSSSTWLWLWSALSLVSLVSPFTPLPWSCQWSVHTRSERLHPPDSSSYQGTTLCVRFPSVNYTITGKWILIFNFLHAVMSNEGIKHRYVCLLVGYGLMVEQCSLSLCHQRLYWFNPRLVLKTVLCLWQTNPVCGLHDPVPRPDHADVRAVPLHLWRLT